LNAKGLTETQEQTTKRLAELKAYLERKLAEHEEEIGTLKSLLDTVDTLLAEKSYRRIEIPRSVVEAISRAPGAGHSQSVQTMSGVHLADIYLEGSDLRVVPSDKLKLDANGAPLRAFLVQKVLDPLRVKDEEAARKEGLSPEKVLSYEIHQEAGLLKEIHIRNYGDERRLNDIRNAVRWALRKMYEKTIGTQ
jgi:hypothetical protein